MLKLGLAILVRYIIHNLQFNVFNAFIQVTRILEKPEGIDIEDEFEPELEEANDEIEPEDGQKEVSKQFIIITFILMF